MPTALDEAVARIRGPRIEDFFAEDEPEATQSFGSPSPPEPTAGRVDFAPPMDGRLRQQQVDDFRQGVGREFPTPERPPPSFSDLAVQPALEGAINLAPAGMRFAGAAAGTVVAGYPLGTAGGAYLTDKYIAQPMEEDLGHAKPSESRAWLNTAASVVRVPGVDRLASPIMRLAARTLEGGAQNVAYDWTAYGFGEGERPTPTSQAKSFAFGAAFDAGLSIHTGAQIDLARAKRAAMPQAVADSVNKNGGATFDLDGNDLFGTPYWSVALPGRTKTIVGDPTPAHIEAYKAEQAEAFRDGDGRVHVGGWKETVDGQTLTHLDPVVRVADRDAASGLGKDWRQKEIYNLGSRESVVTGGGGKWDGPPPSIKELLKKVPYEQSTIFAKVRDEGQRAAKQLTDWYGDSRLSDVRGELGPLRLDIEGPSGVRPKSKLKMAPSDQNVRANMSRMASDSILNAPGGTTYEKWAGDMTDRFGLKIKGHLKQAWKSGRTLAEAHATGKALHELPTTKAALEAFARGEGLTKWYEPMKRELTRVFGPDTDMFLRFLAAHSPQVNIPGNLQKAFHSYVQWKAGARTVHPEAWAQRNTHNENIKRRDAGQEPLDVPGIVDKETPGFHGALFPEWFELAVNDKPFGGPKVKNFLAAMRGDLNAVVIDVWMQRWFGDKPNAKGKIATMSDLVYQMRADHIRHLASVTGETPARFQERVWQQIKREWPTARAGDDERPYHEIVAEREQNGQRLIDPPTLKRLGVFENQIAAEIEARFSASGKVHPDATGLRPESDFDWSSGQQAKPARRAPRKMREGTRANQAGGVRADIFTSMVQHAMTKALQGMRTFRAYATHAVDRFGERARPYLTPRLWRDATRNALRFAAMDPRNPQSGASKPVPRDLAERASRLTSAVGQQRAGHVNELVERAGVKVGDRSVTSPEELQRLAESAGFMPDVPHRTAGGGVIPRDHFVALAEAAQKHERTLLSGFGQRPMSPRDSTKMVVAALELRAIRAQGREGITEATHAAKVARMGVEALDRGDYGFVETAKKYDIDMEGITKVVNQYTTPGERVAAIRAAVGPLGAGERLRRFVNAGIRWNYFGTKTGAKIAFINAPTAITHWASTLPAAGYSKVFHRGGQYVHMAEAKPSWAAFAHIGKGIVNALDSIRYGITNEKALAGKYGDEAKTGTPASDLIANLPGRLMSAADQLTIGPRVQSDMLALTHERARAKAILEGGKADPHERAAEIMADWQQNPPPWLTEYAERTYRRLADNQKFGEYGEALIKASEMPIIGRLITPFVRSGLSGLRRSVQAGTPVGMLEVLALRKASQSPEAAVAYGARHGMGADEARRAQESGMLHREEAMRVGEMVMGHALLLAAYSLYTQGGITGNPPQGMSTEARDREQGKRPWRAVNTPAGWKDASTVLGSNAPVVTAMVDAFAQFKFEREDNAFDEKVAAPRHEAIAMGAWKGAQSLLRGVPIIDVAMGTSTQGVAMRSLYRNLANGVPYVPALARISTAIADPHERKADGAVDALKAMSPWHSRGLEARLTGTGEPIPKRSWWDPTSTVPPHQNVARDDAAEAGVKVSPPNLKEVSLFIPDPRTGKPEKRELTLPQRRALNGAIATAQSRALQAAYRDAKGVTDRRGKAAVYSAVVDAYKAAVMDRAKAAISNGDLISVTGLTDGLE